MSRLGANALYMGGRLRGLAQQGVTAVARFAAPPGSPAAIEKEVLRIIRRTFGPHHQVEADKSWRANGADNLDLIEIAIMVEDRFEIAVPDQLFIEHATPAEFIARIVAICQAKEAAHG